MNVDAKIADLMEATAHCNNCGSADSKVIHEPGRAQINQVVKCTNCGLMFAYPRVRPNYERYDKDSADAPPLTALSEQVKHTADKMADYRRLADDLGRILPEKGRLIEVGSYSGVLTDHFRRAGWDAAGIEPDGLAADYAKAEFGVEVHRGTLETVDLPPASVDAVVMLHVIEHVDDPTANVRRARELLRKGGVFVVETPTYDSISYKLLGRRERSISCDGHIFFYTKDTLTKLLENNGYTIVRIDKVGRTMSVGRLLYNVGVMSKSNKLKSVLRTFSDRFNLEKAYLYLNMHDMIRIYAAKA